MDLPLILAGLAAGVAASPHCAVMCGAPCAALTRGCGRSAGGFHAGRLVGYMAGGAVAAGSVSALAAWSQAAPAVRPLWTLLHLAVLTIGVWWLVTGRPPAWMNRGASAELPLPSAAAAGKGSATALPLRFVSRPGKPMKAGIAGLAWVAWPCAALQAALVLSAMASSTLGGALVMGAFALGSMPVLAFGPWVWARWQARRGRTGSSSAQVSTLAYRVAGAGLVMAAGWALTHGLWERVAAWCLS